jgi:hypothetical protein
MPTIVVDIGHYFARTNRFPPKRGMVSVLFQVGDQPVRASGFNFEVAVNVVKKTARKMKVNTITLLDINPL